MSEQASSGLKTPLAASGNQGLDAPLPKPVSTAPVAQKAAVTGPLPASSPNVFKRIESAIEHVAEVAGHDIGVADKAILAEVHAMLLKLKIVRDQPVVVTPLPPATVAKL